MPLKEELLDTLSFAIINLLNERNKFGNWGDIRSTGLALWAINESLIAPDAIPNDLPNLLKEIDLTTCWLSEQARQEDVGFSWESEAWDTSLAVIALSFDAQYKDRIDQAIHWLYEIKESQTGVWYDEIWETTLSTVAQIRSERIRKRPLPQQRWSWIEKILHWMSSIPSKKSGEYVCPHYSGFLVWLLGEIKGCQTISPVMNTKAFQLFQDKTIDALLWLLSSINNSESSLWSPYTFSNSYIVIGISTLQDKMRMDHIAKIVNWFKDHQGKSGSYEDIEDTSLAILALSALFRQIGFDKKALNFRLSNLVTDNQLIKRPCFIGYSSQAYHIAMELKEHIERVFPMVDVIDWKWDFKLGQILYEEIKRACDKSHAAIFLVTKDDTQVISTNSFRQTPRDNIIFEYGYFSGRIGIDKTILVVEADTKVPSDLGGILFVHMADRNNLGNVKIDLDRALRTILNL